MEGALAWRYLTDSGFTSSKTTTNRTATPTDTKLALFKHTAVHKPKAKKKANTAGLRKIYCLTGEPDAHTYLRGLNKSSMSDMPRCPRRTPRHTTQPLLRLCALDALKMEAHALSLPPSSCLVWLYVCMRARARLFV